MKEQQEKVKKFLSRSNLRFHPILCELKYIYREDEDKIAEVDSKDWIKVPCMFDRRDNTAQIVCYGPCQPKGRTQAIVEWLAEELRVYRRELKGDEINFNKHARNFMTFMGLEPDIGTTSESLARFEWTKVSFKSEVPGICIKAFEMKFSDTEISQIAQSIEHIEEEVANERRNDVGQKRTLNYHENIKVPLKRHRKRKDFSDDNKVRFDPKLCITKPSPDFIVEAVKGIMKKPANQQPENLTILFHGVPGSGKSHAAKYIAGEIGTPLLIKSYADIQSKYVGEGEQNLKEAFDRAEDESAILLLDEVDSLASSRNNAQQDYTKTMVNQFLTCVDNYRGIIICTTNFTKTLDPAFLRRFYLKLQFEFLDKEGQEAALKFFFPRRFRNKRWDYMQFLTAGDFKVVAQKSLYLPKTPTFEEVRSMLEEEVKLKIETLPEVREAARHPIGFK